MSKLKMDNSQTRRYKKVKLGTLNQQLGWHIILEDEAKEYHIAYIAPAGVDVRRFVSCWNACTQLDNPEQDLPKIIEALKDTNQTLRFSSYADGIIFKRSIELANEALTLVKE